jgi:hypothetical protein
MLESEGQCTYIRVCLVCVWEGGRTRRAYTYNTHKTLFRVHCYFALSPRVANMFPCKLDYG